MIDGFALHLIQMVIPPTDAAGIRTELFFLTAGGLLYLLPAAFAAMLAFGFHRPHRNEALPYNLWVENEREALK